MNVEITDVQKKFKEFERQLIYFIAPILTRHRALFNRNLNKEFTLLSRFFESNQKVTKEVLIELSISNHQNHKALYTIWFLVESLNQIDGCRATLEDIKKGSIKTKIKAIFENEQAREEFQRLLDNTRKLAEGKMTKEYEEAKKAEAEKEKIKIETEIKKKELEDAISEETDLKKALELELLYQQIEETRLANERSKIENKRSELQLFQEKKKALQELLAEEFISHDQFNMMLSGLDFINKTGNVFEVGKATSKQIDQAGEGEAEEEVV